MTQRTNESRLAPRAVRMPSKTKKVIHDDPVVLAARQKLARRIESITGTAGEHVTAVPGVVLYHRDEQTPCYRASYKTSLSIFVQGRKHVILGQTEYVCDCSSFLLSSIDVPAQSQIVEASEKTPLLVMFLRFDMPMVRDVLTQEDLPEAEAHSDRQGLAVGETTPGLLEACQRLLNLVDTPEDIPFLSPLIQREIIYRLLKTPQASRLRSIATSGDLVQRTARAISWLRANFTKPLSIEELANTARMGVSTLHHQFRALTSMSPLQYQKMLRLQTARERMLMDGLDATTAAYEVGYESINQFSREYSRCFGLPPIRDIRALKSNGLITEARVG